MEEKKKEPKCHHMNRNSKSDGCFPTLFFVDQAHVPAAFPWKFDGIGTHMGQTAAKITQFL